MRRYNLCLFVLIFVTSVGIALLIVHSFNEKISKPMKRVFNSSNKGNRGHYKHGERSFPSHGNPLEYFNISDALYIQWGHGVNSQDYLKYVLDGDYQMIEGDIIYGMVNQTLDLIMAHPPEVTSDLTLNQWLDDILERNDKAPKLDFKSERVVGPSLELLAEKASKVTQPVWVNADVVRGPGGGQVQFDPEAFLSTVNSIYPNVTLSLGFTTRCCGDRYERAMMEEMLQISTSTYQPVTIPARAALLKDSWDEFKWILSQDDKFTITVWTPAGRDDWEGATSWDMLYVRNDCDVRKIYYDLPGDQFAYLRNMSDTAGVAVNYFDVEDRDGVYITWAHAVNSQDELQEALEGGLMFLEADVLLRGQGTANQTDIPIMAHPPNTDSDITLDEWLAAVTQTKRGIKLDFKSDEVVTHAMAVVAKYRDQLHQPIMINADIFRGPGGSSQGRDGGNLLHQVMTYFPEVTLSIGWTTGATTLPGGDMYTQQQVDEMLQFIDTSNIQQPITFPLRAKFVRKSWPQLKRLLDHSRAHTFTIWTSVSDDVEPDDMVFLREQSEISRIYYDLPEPLMGDFLDRINITRPTITADMLK